jgi:hypothetical protein
VIKVMKKPAGAPVITVLKKPAGAAAGAAGDAGHKKAPQCPDLATHHGCIMWGKSKILHSESKDGWRVWADAKTVTKEKLIKGGEEAWPHVIKYLKGA